MNINILPFILLFYLAPSFNSQTALLQQISSNASSNTITVFIPQVDDSGNSIRYVNTITYGNEKCIYVTMLQCSHYYIVISLEKLENPEAVRESELLPANKAKRNADFPSLYVTASVNYNKYRPTFTIGDDSISIDPISQTKFYNIPLQKQQAYYYFIRAYSDAHTTEVSVLN